VIEILRQHLFSECRKQKQVKNCVSKYLLMELNIRIAIPQLVDNKQVYEEIPPVLVLSSLLQ
jgi:hypothetical protein